MGCNLECWFSGLSVLARAIFSLGEWFCSCARVLSVIVTALDAANAPLARWRAGRPGFHRMDWRSCLERYIFDPYALGEALPRLADRRRVSCLCPSRSADGVGGRAISPKAVFSSIGTANLSCCSWTVMRSEEIKQTHLGVDGLCALRAICTF